MACHPAIPNRPESWPAHGGPSGMESRLPKHGGEQKISNTPIYWLPVLMSWVTSKNSGTLKKRHFRFFRSQRWAPGVGFLQRRVWSYLFGLRRRASPYKFEKSKAATQDLEIRASFDSTVASLQAD